MSLPIREEEFGKAPLTLVEARKRAVKGAEPINSMAALMRSVGIQQPVLQAERAAKRNTSSYTKAQMNEKPALRVLLYELCKTIQVDEGLYQRTGRPKIRIQDIVFSLVYKVYMGSSSRRFMSDMQHIYDLGFVSRPLSYNSICGHFIKDAYTPLLNSLIEGVAAAFAGIETKFAIDSTGFSIPKLSKWCDEKHGWRKRREWMKCHVMCGTRTHIVTAVEVTKRDVGDPRKFEPLVNSTHPAFHIDEVAADRAYSTIKNLELVDRLGAIPAIPFKHNANPFRHASDSAWSRMFHFFALNQVEWREMVNRQNHAESTFSQIKRKFGEKIFNKSEVGQTNEILCKILCHNLCVLIYWLYEFGVEGMLGEIKPEAPPGPPKTPKCDAMSIARFSLDSPIPRTSIAGSEVKDIAPLQIDELIEREAVDAIIGRLMKERGLTEIQAWAEVAKVL